MLITGFELRLLDLALRVPFGTSYGAIDRRRPILVRIFGDGHEGWAECPADVAPSPHADPVAAAWEQIEAGIAPNLLRLTFEHPLDQATRLPSDPGWRPAVAAVDQALWDLHTKALGLPLWHVIGGVDRSVQAGVVIGIPDDLDALMAEAQLRLDEGYRRLKLKIGPGWDLVPLRAIRSRWPHVTLSADANGAYDHNDLEMLRSLDELDLAYLEQPFSAPDLLHHAALAGQIETPVCLDESLTDRGAILTALDLEPGFVLNVKPARLGGLTEAMAVHRLALDRGAALWCGGYLETGIGRAFLVALSTLPGFTMPGDVSASARYWERDLVDPPWLLHPGGTLEPRDQPGIGVALDEGFIDRMTTRRVLIEL